MKNLVVPRGRAPRRIKAGLLKNLVMNLDLTCDTQLYLGLSERELVKWFEKFTSDAVTAIDIGSNVGAYTVWFLARTKASRILSVEPSPEAREGLTTNLKLNDLHDDPRLTIIDKFVGKQDSLDTCSLDSLSAVISTPCVIKIDVDGPEATILEGARRVLDRAHVRWIVETHSQDLEEACSQLLTETGYKVEIVQNAWWRTIVPEQRPIPHNRWLVAARY
ncbi:MAG TPA: FkbM family methyltransferase [Pirellulales bacterium]|nr:FkbM family methyltransferase [Pirellulales bacterium]